MVSSDDKCCINDYALENKFMDTDNKCIVLDRAVTLMHGFQDFHSRIFFEL